MRRIRVCAIGELPVGKAMKVCEVGRSPIAVFNLGDRYCAIDDTCSHGKASLSAEGRVDGEVVECGWHKGRFSLVTGKAVRFPAMRALQSYSVETEGDDIFVNVADA